MLAEFCDVGDLKVGIQGAEAVGVGFDFDGSAGGDGNQVAEHVADGAGEGAADVVKFAGDGVDCDEHIIRSDGISYIGPGSHGFEIAGFYYGRYFSGFDHGDLLGEG